MKKLLVSNNFKFKYKHKISYILTIINQRGDGRLHQLSQGGENSILDSKSDRISPKS